MERRNDLEAWLSHHDARMLWSAQVPGEDNFRRVKITAYQIGMGVALVQRYSKGDGWELYVPAANSLSVAETLRGAELALNLGIRVQA